MADATDAGLRWLTSEADPAVRVLARRELAGETVAPARALGSPTVQALLAGQQPDGGFGTHPYAKWRGAHWRLVSLVELGVPADHPGCVAAADRVLTWLASPGRLRHIPVLAGRARRCASQEGNAVAVGVRLGLAGDPRVTTLAERLVAWQWPDGGWNCDRRPDATHSSFAETLPALWGLSEYAGATGEPAARAAARRAADLLLDHRVFRSHRTGAPINPTFEVAHYPPYWHYDVVQALLVLARAGYGADPRGGEARALVAARRRAGDGRVRAGGRWWRPPGSASGNVDVVDWSEVGSQLLTLNALRIEAAAGERPAG